MNALKLGDLVEITSSKRVMFSDYVDSGIPFYRSKEIIELHNGNPVSTELFISEEHYTKIVSKFGALTEGDILLTSVGTLGIPYQVVKGDKFYFKDGNLTWFRNFNERANPRFIYYWLTSSVAKQRFEEITIGSTQKALTIVALKSIPINLPDIKLQERIVTILNALNGKLKNNRQINQTLEAMAQALFKSWFVDFEPVKAKLSALAVGGSADDANLAAMSAISGKTTEQLLTLKTTNPDQYQQLYTTADLFPSEMVDSELGEIPKGWGVSEIGKEVTVVGGGTPSTSSSDFWENGDVFWATPKDLSSLSDKVLIDTERKITQQGLSKISSGLLPVNTVLMSSRAPVGYLALAKVPVAINQGFIAMKCDNKLSTEYVIQWCVANMDEIQQRASGTTFLEISKKNFNPIRAVVPTQDVLNKYSQVVKNYYAQIEQNIRQTASLVDIRDALLPKLLAGELLVDD